MTQFYKGITPPVIDQMTYAEVAEYVTQMDEAKAEARRRAQGR